MTQVDQDKWNKRYQQNSLEPRAARVLMDNLHLLPRQGSALDLACGLGGNALLLAERGLSVEAWDLSPVAIDKLTHQARDLPIQARTVDINVTSLPVNQFDVIVVSYFLERRLAPAIIDALRPNGLLFYQTFNQNQCGRGPTNPAWRLQDNELLRLFKPLSVRYYREEGMTGDAQAIRDEALLVAQKILSPG